MAICGSCAILKLSNVLSGVSNYCFLFVTSKPNFKS